MQAYKRKTEKFFVSEEKSFIGSATVVFFRHLFGLLTNEILKNNALQEFYVYDGPRRRNSILTHSTHYNDN